MITAQARPATILVTGATGNIGRELVNRLAGHGDIRVRATTRDPDTAALPEGVEPVRADLRDAAALRPALAGADALFLVSRVGDDAAILSAARRAGVAHVVLVSSITVLTHPHLGPARENAAVEQLVRDSGMAWTILRPTQFASNALWWADSIRETGEVEVPFAGIGLPAIHPGDIAGVASAALTGSAHRGRTYPLTGPARITPREQVQVIASALGRALTVTEIDRTRARERMLAAMDSDTADALLDVTGGDANDELLAVRDTVARITGFPARTFRDWVSRNIARFR
ncbi:SDR family oxidoreductase [Nocardia spumae]|uniref:SDR family oxidoreductase n=1 Tax=Nocardia spumae TaxID=2887190 RepID=UPI001D14D21C|nr:NAD(P)H-binding protein [Nocardia spumae]